MASLLISFLLLSWIPQVIIWEKLWEFSVHEPSSALLWPVSSQQFVGEVYGEAGYLGVQPGSLLHCVSGITSCY